jgi:exonuclease III
MVRVVTWNILHGGGPVRTPEIALALHALAPDVVALCEFRAARGSQIRGVLAGAGLTYQAVSCQGDGNGVLLASRWALEPAHPSPAGFEGRWLGARCPALGVTFCAVHAPDETDRPRQAAFWGALIDLARHVENSADAVDSALIVLGDANLGRRGQDGDAFRGEPLLGAFLTLGMRDAWRWANPDAREPSWVGALGERRLDAAYLSRALWDAILDVRFEHGLRQGGLSDHSPLVLNLRLTPKREAPYRSGLFGGGDREDGGEG